MKLLKISLVSIPVILILAVVLVAFSLGGIVKTGVEKFGPKVLGVNVDVNSVDISILDGSAKITGLKVGNPQGFKSEQAFYLDAVDIKLDPMSIFSDTVNISHVNITNPEVTYEIGFGKTNISTLQKNIGKDHSGSSEVAVDKSDASEPKKVVIDEVNIEGAKVVAALGSVDQSILLPAIKLTSVGTENKPATFASAAKQVISAVIVKIGSADLSVLSGGLSKQLKGAGEAITEGIKGIFD